MELSAPPSSTPAKIRNNVAAKYQGNSNSVANSTVATPPTDIAQARLLRACQPSSVEIATPIPFPSGRVTLFRQTSSGSSEDERVVRRSAHIGGPGRRAAGRGGPPPEPGLHAKNDTTPRGATC